MDVLSSLSNKDASNRQIVRDMANAIDGKVRRNKMATDFWREAEV